MPYIGKTPLVGAYQLCDAITTSATATYNLTVGGSAVVPGSAQNCIVSLNGVIQAPVNAFTVSGSQITFSSALTATDVIDFIVILGNVFDIGKPTDGSVTNASVASNAAIALSKLATTGTMTFASTIGVGGATPAASGAGITFPATASASSDANTLDDYEEGTFTPTITFGNNSVSMTFAADGQKGYYTKIGRVVNGTVWIQLTNKGTSTGTARVANLPFTSFNQTNGFHGASIDHYFNISTYSSIGAYLPPNESGYVITGGNPPSDIATSVTHSQFNNDTYIIMSFTYQT